MSKRTIAVIGAVAMAGGGLLVGSAAPAGASFVCSLDQVTDTEAQGNGFPAISDDGNRIAFESSADYAGENADHSQEIFLLDRTTDQITQVSAAGSGTAREPSISGDGDKIVYDSNGDGNFDVYLYDVSSDFTSPLTVTSSPRVSRQASISGDGTTVAFSSDADLGLIPGGNNDNSQEIWVRNLLATAPLQITNSTGGGTGEVDLDADGSRAVFQSNRNLVPSPPGNADFSTEIFRWEAPATLVQVTDTPAGKFNVHPEQTADGSRIVFQTDASIGGTNIEGDQEVYLHDFSGLTPFTNALTFGTGNSTRPAINGDGQRVVFASDKDVVVGQNADLSEEQFVRDFGGPTTHQTTSATNGTLTDASISPDGAHIAGRGGADFTGINADLNAEIFVTTCGRTIPDFTDYPAGSTFYDQVQWMSAAGVASGFPDQTFRPQDFVKRQQMANFLYNLAGRPEFIPPDNANRTFSDYPSSSTFYLEVEWMAATGVASGFPDGTFRPQDFVKRQQMANFLYNMADNPSFTPPANSSRSFTDYPSSSTYYLEVEWMAAEEIASGFPDQTFRPQDFVKRQQMANFVYNLAANIGVDSLVG